MYAKKIKFKNILIKKFNLFKKVLLSVWELN
jgi:hypothetical protein